MIKPRYRYSWKAGMWMPQGVSAISEIGIHAYARPDYAAHIAAMATDDEANLKMRFETAKLQVEVWRSKCSQRKFEFNANDN